MTATLANPTRAANRGRSTPQIHFLLVGHTTSLMLNPLRPNGLVFEPPGEPRLSLRPVNQSDDAFAYRDGLECKISLSIPSTSKQAAFVKALQNGRFKPYGADPPQLPHLVLGEERISRDGTLREGCNLPFALVPPDLQAMCGEVFRILSSKVSRFISLLRWTQNFDSPHGKFMDAFLYWSDDLKKPYIPFPVKPNSVTLPGMTGIQWTDAHQELTQELFSNPDAEEPLAHELLREAIALSADSQRSGLLTAVTALETGIKSHLAKLAPDTEWLLKETQSPPIFRILRDYLPELYKRVGKDVSFWPQLKPTIKRVQKLIEHRNIVAHTGFLPIEQHEFDAHIALVSDILYVLDVLEGFEWARTRVSPSVRKALGWPDPIERRMSFSIIPVE